MKILPDIEEVQHRGGYRLYVRYDDGLEGEINLSQVIRFEGVFAELKDVREFAKVGLYPDHETICWPNGADVAPEKLRAAIETP